MSEKTSLTEERELLEHFDKVTEEQQLNEARDAALRDITL